MIADMLRHVISLRHFSEYPPMDYVLKELSSRKFQLTPSLVNLVNGGIRALHAKKPSPKWVSGNDTPEEPCELDARRGAGFSIIPVNCFILTRFPKCLGYGIIYTYSKTSSLERISVCKVLPSLPQFGDSCHLLILLHMDMTS
jgi:hypothetical protein